MIQWLRMRCDKPTNSGRDRESIKNQNQLLKKELCNMQRTMEEIEQGKKS